MTRPPPLRIQPIPHARSAPTSPEEIFAEALALLAEGGVDGLGMRALARRLGSSTSTLYRQFPGGKDELCDRLAEQVMARIVTALGTPDDTAEWSAVVEQSAVVAFDVLRGLPHSAELFAGQVEFGPMGLVRYEASLSLLLACGMSPTAAAAADHALARLIVGYALQSARDEAPGRESVAAYYRRLDPTRFPSVASVRAALPEDLRAEFVFALQTFMIGLRQLVADARA